MAVKGLFVVIMLSSTCNVGLTRSQGSDHPSIANGLPQSTKVAETLSLARKWIATCIGEHQRCNTNSQKTGWYPTRLLDCGTAEAPETCRLVETSDTVVDGPYMTLSHCWGHTDCLKLTTENRAEFLDQIPLSLLPQLYQNAVDVTKNLGVRYLWIDSLCIIQREHKSNDWRAEVAVMDKIYSNSFCNISPTDAADSHHSMFCARDPDLLYPQVANISADGNISPYIVRAAFWEAEVSKARLNTRAWVIQERLLSPRVLHFGRHQMLWECQERDACEVYPDGLPVAFDRLSGRLKDLASSHDAAADGTDDSVVAYRPWARIVSAYTACGLTFPEDKLVALSGVAKVMANILRDDYVAGMWRRYLERELLWSVSPHRRGNTTQSTIYRAPSWSWAAVEGEIHPGLVGIGAADMLIEVQDVQLDYTTDDSTGLIQGGWLRLRGVLKQLGLQRHYPSPSGRDWDMTVNGVPVSIPSDSLVQEPQPHIIPDVCHGDFEDIITGGDLYGIPGRAKRDDDGSIHVLILRLEDREGGVFRRVGLARGWGKDVKEKILARAVDESQFPCELYKDGLHSIRII